MTDKTIIRVAQISICSGVFDVTRPVSLPKPPCDIDLTPADRAETAPRRRGLVARQSVIEERIGWIREEYAQHHGEAQ